MLYRRSGIDLARIMACLGVVYFHVSGVALGQFRMTFFAALIGFIIKSSKSATFGTFALRRFDRLLVPFLFWTLIVCCRHVNLTAFYILTGMHSHLWFLTFAFAASLLAFVFVDVNRWLLLLLSIVATFTVRASGWDNLWHLWAPLLVATIFGIAIGAYKLRQSKFLFAFFGLLWFVACWYGSDIFAGVLFLLTAITFPWHIAVSNKLATISFGVYLIHPFVLSILKHATPNVTFQLLLTLLLSASGIIMMQYTAFGRLILGMDRQVFGPVVKLADTTDLKSVA